MPATSDGLALQPRTSQNLSRLQTWAPLPRASRPQTFHPFPRLPRELQMQILQMAVIPPREGESLNRVLLDMSCADCRTRTTPVSEQPEVQFQLLLNRVDFCEYYNRANLMMTCRLGRMIGLEAWKAEILEIDAKWISENLTSRRYRWMPKSVIKSFEPVLRKRLEELKIELSTAIDTILDEPMGIKLPRFYQPKRSYTNLIC